METRYFDVDAGKYRKAQAPHVLETIGLGPCLGIGIYDRQNKIGYLGHILPGDSSALRAMITRVLLDCKDSGKLDVTLTGVSLEPEDEKDKRLEERKFALEYLIQSGFKDRRIKKMFNDELLVGISMIFRLNDGSITLEKD